MGIIGFVFTLSYQTNSFPAPNLIFERFEQMFETTLQTKLNAPDRYGVRQGNDYQEMGIHQCKASIHVGTTEYPKFFQRFVYLFCILVIENGGGHLRIDLYDYEEDIYPLFDVNDVEKIWKNIKFSTIF